MRIPQPLALKQMNKPSGGYEAACMCGAGGAWIACGKREAEETVAATNG